MNEISLVLVVNVMDPSFLFELAIKMAITASVVIAASWIAERAGAFISALVITLPLSAAPTYVFIAIDHDSKFIEAAALASLIANAANVMFCAVYSLLAQTYRRSVSLAAAIGTWFAFTVSTSQFPLALSGAIVVNLVVFSACIPVVSQFRKTKIPIAERRWFDLPMRAGMVAFLVTVIVALSAKFGPTFAGALAVFPVVLTSVVFVFQSRVGGQAAAAITASAVVGLVGYGAALVLLNISAVWVGSPLALTMALCVSIAWNVAVFLTRARKSRTDRNQRFAC